MLEQKDEHLKELTLLLKELQTTVSMQSEQANLLRQTVADLEAKEQRHHQATMEEVELSKVAREAQTELIGSLDMRIENLQNVTLALTNVADQLEAISEELIAQNPRLAHMQQQQAGVNGG